MISSAAADLVIDASGTHGVSRLINTLCHELKVPSLYTSVTNGSGGGEIVRVHAATIMIAEKAADLIRHDLSAARD